MTSTVPTRPPRIAVIGAGPSGLAVLKTLREAGLTDVTCFEAQAELGGNWVFRDTTGHASVYETTHIISSKRLSQYSDFPMPAAYPDFPSHSQMLAYFQAYAAHFGLAPHIRFQTRVVAATPVDGDRWRLSLQGPDGASEELFDRLVVCSGHHWDPALPQLPGTFDGSVMHAHDYRRAEPFRDRRVLVVGGGNSACDIAVAISRVARQTAISMRRGYHIVPKIVFGMPVDIAYRRLRRVPKPIRQRLLALMLKLLVGPYKRYGLPEPARPVLEMHPTLNSELLDRLRHGAVETRPGLAGFDGPNVRYADGRLEAFDDVIFATGYRTRFPFLAGEGFDWSDAVSVPLYLKMMPAGFPTLDFIGLFQPIGCIWPLAELQARIVALQAKGILARPADLDARIAREVAHPHWNFERSPRHAIEIDIYDFEAELRREIGDAWQRNAARAGTERGNQAA
jgi:hypothetical protein